LAKKDWMMTCLDGFTPESLVGSAHPRSYGGMTRKLRVLAMDEGVITVPFAVRGMTSLAAQFYGIADRGLLKPGFQADVVVLDEAKVRDRATFDRPFVYSEGTVHVLVNGRFAFRDGKPTGTLPGRPIRRGEGATMAASSRRPD
jgi:N-acyl-D-aspartate/D-glutamate deacylase